MNKGDRVRIKAYVEWYYDHVDGKKYRKLRRIPIDLECIFLGYSSRMEGEYVGSPQSIYGDYDIPYLTNIVTYRVAMVSVAEGDSYRIPFPCFPGDIL